MEVGEHTLTPMVRAIGNDGVIQDGKWEDMFNARGLLNTTPHKINIKLNMRH